MDVTNSRSDLGIAVAVDLLFEEIDEAAIALEHGQNPQVRAGRGTRKQRLDPTRESDVGDDSPERSQCQPDSIQIPVLSIPALVLRSAPTSKTRDATSSV